MKFKNTITLFCVMIFSFTAHTQCNDSLKYSTFRTNWNNKVNVIKDGTWKLPVIDFTTIKKDSFDMIHQFVMRGITFKATISKTGCINKAAIVGRINDSLNVQGSLAMLYIIDLFNHELDNKTRQKVFDSLRAEADSLKGASSKQIGKNKYIYEPGLVANVLTVIIGK